MVPFLLFVQELDKDFLPELIVVYDIRAFILPNRLVGGFVWELWWDKLFGPSQGPSSLFHPFNAGVQPWFLPIVLQLLLTAPSLIFHSILVWMIIIFHLFVRVSQAFTNLALVTFRTLGCLAVSWPLSFYLVVTTKSVSRHCHQLFPGRQNCPQLKMTGLSFTDCSPISSGCLDVLWRTWDSMSKNAGVDQFCLSWAQDRAWQCIDHAYRR